MNDVLQGFLTNVAPTVASALLGPLAGTAIAGLGRILGVSSATTESVAKAISDGRVTPEQLAEIRKLEMEYKDHEAERNFKYSELEFNDRDSARKMQTAQPSLWPGILSAITTAAVLGVIAARMYGAKLPDDPVTIQLIGSLTTGWGMCLAYWFGTTHSSREKNLLLAASTPPAPDA